MLWVNWCQFAVALANKVKIGFAFYKLGIYHGVYFDCIKIINLKGYIDLLDTSVIVFVNNLLWFVFHFMLFAELSSWSVVSFAGFRACLIYSCLTVYEFSFILLIHHIILLILISVLSVTFWTLTYYKIWILLIIYCFIWNYWIIYFVTCLEVFWGVMS